MLPDAAPEARPTDYPRWRRMRGIAFHAVGVVLVVMVAVIGLYAWALTSFFTSVCNSSPAVVEAHRHALQAIVLCIGFGIAAVPGLWAVIARKQRRAAVPWAVTTGVLIVATLVIVVTAKPQQWCLF